MAHASNLVGRRLEETQRVRKRITHPDLPATRAALARIRVTTLYHPNYTDGAVERIPLRTTAPEAEAETAAGADPGTVKGGGLRVVLDCRYIRERPSGIGTYVQALVDHLPALAPHDRFELWAHPLASRPLSHAPNVSERTVRASPNSLGTLLWPARLAPLDSASVFHEPHNLLGRAIPCATVVTVHDALWLEAPHLAGRYPWRLLEQPFARTALWSALHRATRILAVSTATADALMRLAPETRGRIRVTLEAADPRFRPAADRGAARDAAARLLGSEERYVLVVGQDAPYKAHGIALHAFARTAGRERLVFVQRTRSGRGLEALARALGVNDRVHFLPTLDFDDLRTLLQAAVALIQPSRYEGFGLPALEAMASGCPVLASDIPALAEVLGGAGIATPAGDVEALAHALRRLLDNPGLGDELRGRGIERAAQFSWARTAAATLDAYREAAAAGPDSRRR